MPGQTRQPPQTSSAPQTSSSSAQSCSTPAHDNSAANAQLNASRTPGGGGTPASPPGSPGAPSDKTDAARQLRHAVSRVRNETIGEREGHRSLIRTRREHWIVGALSESAGNAGSLPDDTIWEPILGHLRRADDAIAGYLGAADNGASFLATVRSEVSAAEQAYRNCANQIRLYRERTEDGAESRIESLEIVIATCALVFTTCAAAAAIPIAAGGGLAGANAAGVAAIGAAAAPGTVAATSATGIGLSAAGGGLGAGGFAAATTAARQGGEIATGQRETLDMGAIFEAASEAAANTVISTLVGGALGRVFGALLAPVLNAGVARVASAEVARRFAAGGTPLIMDLLSGAVATPFSLAVSRFLERNRAHPPPNQQAFMDALAHDMAQGAFMTALLAAITHGAIHLEGGAPASAPTTPAGGGDAAPASNPHNSVVVDPANPVGVSTRIPTTGRRRGGTGLHVSSETPAVTPAHVEATPAPAASPAVSPSVASAEVPVAPSHAAAPAQTPLEPARFGPGAPEPSRAAPSRFGPGTPEPARASSNDSARRGPIVASEAAPAVPHAEHGPSSAPARPTPVGAPIGATPTGESVFAGSNGRAIMADGSTPDVRWREPDGLVHFTDGSTQREAPAVVHDPSAHLERAVAMQRRQEARSVAGRETPAPATEAALASPGRQAEPSPVASPAPTTSPEAAATAAAPNSDHSPAPTVTETPGGPQRDPGRVLDAEARYWEANQRLLPEGDSRRARPSGAGSGPDLPGVSAIDREATPVGIHRGNERRAPDGTEIRVLEDRLGARNPETNLSPRYSDPSGELDSHSIDLGDGARGYRVQTGSSVTTPASAPGQANPHVLATTGLAGCSAIGTRSASAAGGERLSLAHALNEQGGQGQFRALHAEIHREINRGSTDIDSVMRLAPHHTEAVSHDEHGNVSGGFLGRRSEGNAEVDIGRPSTPADSAEVTNLTRQRLATQLNESLNTNRNSPRRNATVDGEHIVVRNEDGTLVSRVHVEVAIAPSPSEVHQQVVVSSDGMVVRNGNDAGQGPAATVHGFGR